MSATQTKKRALSCRVSNETFEAVKALTEGDNCPFESTSEYLYTLIISDLARRAMGDKSLAEEVKALLQTPELRALIKEIARE